MKVVTWNINGIRAGSTRSPLKNILETLDSDIICLQETKVTRDQLDDATANVDGYNSYFSFSKKRSGYSGVAIYCKDSATPIHAEEGLSSVLSLSAKDVVGCYGDMAEFTPEELQSLDFEGRAVMTEHTYRDKDGSLSRLVVINVYCPRADPENEERLTYKLQFYKLLQKRAESLLQDKKHVIIVGDINCSHKKIDHCDPTSDEEKYASNPSRMWLNQLLREVTKDQKGSEQTEKPSTDDDSSVTPKSNQPFVDTFRYCYPHQRKAFTCWSTLTSARETNYGTRIDYVFTDVEFCVNELKDCKILTDIQGSDHCPVKAEFENDLVASEKCPALCAKFMPEFVGKQQKLSAFFKKLSPGTAQLSDEEEENEGDNILRQKRSGEELSHSDAKKLKRAGKNKNADIKSFFLSKETVKSSKHRKKSKKSKHHHKEKKTRRSSEAEVGALWADMKHDATVTMETQSKCSSEDSKTEEMVTMETQSSCSSQESKTEETVKLEISQVHSIIDGTLSQSNKPAEEGKGDGVVVSENGLKVDTTCDGKTDLSAANDESSDSNTKTTNKKQLALSWKSILKGPPPPPLCKGHREKCVLRTVKKAGPNLGKRFFVCNRPEGHRKNPQARCGHFEWVKEKK